MYICLSGRTPFATGSNDDSPEKILQRIGSGNVDLENGVSDYQLPTLTNLINKIILTDLAHRLQWGKNPT